MVLSYVDHVYNYHTLFTNGSVICREFETVLIGTICCSAAIFGTLTIL